jgi:hypothetical protein
MDGGELGHFSLLEKIGEGGMGRVYKARDKRLDRLVAIKLLAEARSTDADRSARFVQEAKAASALNHPNIITIHEIGEQDGQTYIVMELVNGKPLNELIPGLGGIARFTPPGGRRVHDVRGPVGGRRTIAPYSGTSPSGHLSGMPTRSLRLAITSWCLGSLAQRASCSPTAAARPGALRPSSVAATAGVRIGVRGGRYHEYGVIGRSGSTAVLRPVIR